MGDMDIVRLVEIRKAVQYIIDNSDHLRARSNGAVLQVLRNDIKHSSLLDQRMPRNRTSTTSATKLCVI